MSILTGALGILLFSAAPRAAEKVSGSALLKSARSALDSGHCEAASRLFLSAREAGDSSASLLFGLSQALECSGRMEEALGATYMGANSDTTGKLDLMLERAQLLRRLGLEDLARQTEKEFGVSMAKLIAAGADAGPSRRFDWVWNRVPILGVNLGWAYQGDQPHTARILKYNDSLLSERSLSKVDLPPVLDSISLAGGSWQATAALNWGAGGSSGGIWVGPSSSVALDDDTLGWRSVGVGFDIDGYWLATGNLMMQVGLSTSRTWFATSNGPLPNQDNLGGSIGATWSRLGWGLSLPQTLRALRTNSGDWTWTGSHAAGVSRDILPKAKLSIGASWAWNLDPSGPLDDYIWSRVVEGEGLDSSIRLYNAQLYTPQRLTTGKLTNSPYLSTGSPGTISVNDLTRFQVPFSRNTDWTQTGLSTSATLGPWASIYLIGSVQWAETFYPHDQEGSRVDVSYAVYNLVDSIPVLLVLRDSTTKNQFLVGSTTSNVPLVPWRFWKIHRRDQCWTTQVGAIWRPVKWFGLRATWVWSRNISNLEDYVEGSSYIRNVVSMSGTTSW